MQIELIGCTSAGKSTFTREILKTSREQGLPSLSGDEFVLTQIQLNWINFKLVRNLVLNLVALLASLFTWRKNLQLYRYAARILLQQPISGLNKVYLLRNVLKKIGIFEIVTYFDAEQQIIWIDEGVLQIAHNLFVHDSVSIAREEIAAFARLAPLPDVIVYLRQPESLLIDRATVRGHKRIPDNSSGGVAHFIRQAVTTFEILTEEPAIKNKLLVINGGKNITATTNWQANPELDLALKVISDSVINGSGSVPIEFMPVM